MGRQFMVLLSSATLVLMGAGVGFWWWSDARGEGQHGESDETEIIVGAPEGARCRLYESGRTIAAARLLRDEACHSLWAPAGTYFMAIRWRGEDLYYPVPVLGYRQGPDRHGSFVLTVRDRIRTDPPPPHPASPRFAFVPSGHFLIGDRQTPREPHYVWVPEFHISSFELTNAEFRTFLEDPNGYASDAHWTEDGREWKRRTKSQTSASARREDAERARFGEDDQPVTGVTWFEAVAYTRWLTLSRGGGRWRFSLPTDAEWEKAARGPDGLDYGLSAAVSDAEAGLYNWGKNPGAPQTVVGAEATRRSFRPNRYGIYHASGNVAEWTSSLFWPYNREKTYADDARNLPGTSGSRTVRGGSWYSATSATLCLAYRDAFERNHRSNDLGFRIVARLNP